MRRLSKGSSFKLSADSRGFISVCEALLQSGSRLEERAWERDLDSLLQKALKQGHQHDIDSALEYLFKAQSEAYELLLQSAEAMSESCTLEHEGRQYDALLIAAPILAWTRFAIASGPISPEMIVTLSGHMQADILAPETRLAIAPMLYSIDQLPRTHAETYALTQQMVQAALDGTTVQHNSKPQPTMPFLADTRYLLAVVAAPVGAPLFRWQGSGNTLVREMAQHQWQLHAKPFIERLLPGCGIELLLPDAYFMACREADKQIRPSSIKAAVHYLTHTLKVEPDELGAIIGGFGDATGGKRIDEYRISFVKRPEMDVVYGLVWPLYGEEEAAQEMSSPLCPADLIDLDDAPPAAPMKEIISLLREAGIIHIKQHEEFFPMDFCDDCEAPLYCDLEGELVHAEMPEEAVQSPSHLH